MKRYNHVLLIIVMKRYNHVLVIIPMKRYNHVLVIIVMKRYNHVLVIIPMNCYNHVTVISLVHVNTWSKATIAYQLRDTSLQSQTARAKQVKEASSPNYLVSVENAVYMPYKISVVGPSFGRHTSVDPCDQDVWT